MRAIGSGRRVSATVKPATAASVIGVVARAARGSGRAASDDEAVLDSAAEMPIAGPVVAAARGWAWAATEGLAVAVPEWAVRVAKAVLVQVNGWVRAPEAAAHGWVDQALVADPAEARG